MKSAILYIHSNLISHLQTSCSSNKEGNCKYGNTKLVTMTILPLLCVYEKIMRLKRVANIYIFIPNPNGCSPFTYRIEEERKPYILEGPTQVFKLFVETVTYDCVERQAEHRDVRVHCDYEQHKGFKCFKSRQSIRDWN